MIGAQSDFAVRFQEFVFYAGPIVQMLYWIVVAGAALYAVLLLRRHMSAHFAGGKELPGASRSPAPETAPVSVDEFVE
ncbi:MAG: hypothetical protein KGZ40_03310 [Clostridiales bacterium]|nr:hypothetical protein [Clostridiales bacterium]